jgi:hypothetical protein
LNWPVIEVVHFENGFPTLIVGKKQSIFAVVGQNKHFFDFKRNSKDGTHILIG